MINKIKAKWGDFLMKVPSTELPNWELPNDTIDLLTGIGLPVSDDLKNDPGFMIEFTPDKTEEITHEEIRYLVIARVGRMKIAIQEKSGKIFKLSRPGKHPPIIFMNSSIEHLLAFILIIKRYRPLLIEAGDQVDVYFLNQHDLSEEDRERWKEAEKEADELVAKMVDELKAVDAPALDSGGNYWPMDLFLTAPHPRPDDS